MTKGIINGSGVDKLLYCNVFEMRSFPIIYRDPFNQ